MHLPTSYRQGDVLLQKVSSLPLSCVEQLVNEARLVLAYGESTGHAHAINDLWDGRAANEDFAFGTPCTSTCQYPAKARLWVSPGGNRFLEVLSIASLRHEERAPLQIPPGIYQLPRQVEYAPAGISDVWD